MALTALLDDAGERLPTFRDLDEIEATVVQQRVDRWYWLNFNRTYDLNLGELGGAR